MSYHDVAMRKEHDYGEIISSINFEEKVFEEIDTEHFVEGLAKYLLERHEDLLNPRKKRSDAYSKAKKLYYRNGNITSLDPKQVLEIVEEAIEEGYIWEFKLEEPWHPAIYFDENRLTTVPWQHEKAVLYSGRGEYEFYTKEFLKNNRKVLNFNDLDSVDDLHNAESILKTGYIKPGVRHAQDSEEAEKKTNEHFTRRWAIYLTTSASNIASHYGGSHYTSRKTILEVEIPTKFLKTFSGDLPVNNLSDFFNNFSSPRIFEEKFGSELHYTKTEGSEYPVLPLNYVNGVWNGNRRSDPYFVPLKEHVENLYDQVGERLPPIDNIKLDVGASAGHFSRQGSSEKEEKKFLQMIKSLAKDLSNCYSKLKSSGKYVYQLRNEESINGYTLERPFDGSRLDDFENLIRRVLYFEKKRENVIEVVKNYNFDFENKEIDLAKFLLSKSYEEVEEFEERSKADLKRINKIELNQAIETEHDQKEVEERFRSDLSKILSLNISSESLTELAQSLAQNKEELAKFEKIIKEEIS